MEGTTLPVSLLIKNVLSFVRFFSLHFRAQGYIIYVYVAQIFSNAYFSLNSNVVFFFGIMKILIENRSCVAVLSFFFVVI